MNTHENITELKDSEIFVFGSNYRGDHVGGAALYARQHFGLQDGCYAGLSGKTYAIPTIHYNGLPVDIKQLKKSAEELSQFARWNPNLTFLLTKVGCGIAGFTEEEVSPLFKDAPENIVKPEGW